MEIKQEEINHLDEEVAKFDSAMLNSEKLSEQIRKFKAKKKLTQEMVDLFVKKVTIYERDEIEVELNIDDTITQLFKETEMMQ